MFQFLLVQLRLDARIAQSKLFKFQFLLVQLRLPARGEGRA